MHPWRWGRTRSEDIYKGTFKESNRRCCEWATEQWKGMDCKQGTGMKMIKQGVVISEVRPKRNEEANQVRICRNRDSSGEKKVALAQKLIGLSSHSSMKAFHLLISKWLGYWGAGYTITKLKVPELHLANYNTHPTRPSWHFQGSTFDLSRGTKDALYIYEYTTMNPTFMYS